MILSFTVYELSEILNCLSKVHGQGYAKDEKVARLQAKLSIMLEAKTSAEEVARKAKADDETKVDDAR